VQEDIEEGSSIHSTTVESVNFSVNDTFVRQRRLFLVQCIVGVRQVFCIVSKINDPDTAYPRAIE
jgi:hypothetical protein